MKRSERIGVDLDGKNRFRLLMTFFNARKLGEVRVFETRHGYHLRIRHPRTTLEENLEIRRFLGDDVRRIAMDEVKVKNGEIQVFDVLFQGKKCFDGQIWREVEINPLSEPFWNFKARSHSQGRGQPQKPNLEGRLEPRGEGD